MENINNIIEKISNISNSFDRELDLTNKITIQNFFDLINYSFSLVEIFDFKLLNELKDKNRNIYLLLILKLKELFFKVDKYLLLNKEAFNSKYTEELYNEIKNYQLKITNFTDSLTSYSDAFLEFDKLENKYNKLALLQEKNSTSNNNESYLKEIENEKDIEEKNFIYVLEKINDVIQKIKNKESNFLLEKTHLINNIEKETLVLLDSEKQIKELFTELIAKKNTIIKYNKIISTHFNADNKVFNSLPSKSSKILKKIDKIKESLNELDLEMKEILSKFDTLESTFSDNVFYLEDRKL